MKIDTILELFPQSKSDALLRAWGYDLLREYFTIAEQISPTESPILELATGTGRMCAVLSAVFPNIVTGDSSLMDLPRATQRIPKQFAQRVHFLQLNMENLPFRSGSISTLVCMNTLHELSNPYLCLKEMIRIIHPKGLLVIGDFNQTGFDAMRKINDIVYNNVHPEGSISHDEIERFLSAAFHSIRSFGTQLNLTYFVSDKR